MKRRWLILCLSIMLTVLVTLGAGAETARITGMGHQFVNIEGLDALYANPALLDPPDDVFVMELGGQLRFWNNGLSSKYFNSYLDQEIKDGILAAVKDNGLKVMGGGNQDFKMVIKNVGVFAGIRETGIVSVSGDLVDLILNGNEIDRAYTLDNTHGNFAILFDSGFSYSTPLKKTAEKFALEELKVGFTYHYLYGGFGKMEGQGKLLTVNQDDISMTGDGHLRVETAEQGSGSAYDFGIYAVLDERISLGASVLNIGSLTAKEASYSEYVYDYNLSSNSEEEDSMFEPIVEDQPLDNLSYKLPLAVKLGARYRWTHWMSIYGDYAHISYDGGESEHKFAVGTEITEAEFLPLWFGVTYSTLQRDLIFSGGAGLHLGPVQLDFGYSDLGSLFNNSKSGSLGLNARLAF